MTENNGCNDYARKTALEMVKDLYNSTLDNSKAFSKTVNSIITFSSILFSLIAFLQAFQYLNVYFLIAGVVLYIFILSLSILVIQPHTLSFPVKADWDIMYADQFDKTETEIDELMISSYLNALEINKAIFDKISRWTNIIQALFILLILVVSMALIVG